MIIFSLKSSFSLNFSNTSSIYFTLLASLELFFCISSILNLSIADLTSSWIVLILLFWPSIWDSFLRISIFKSTTFLSSSSLVVSLFSISSSIRSWIWLTSLTLEFKVSKISVLSSFTSSILDTTSFTVLSKNSANSLIFDSVFISESIIKFLYFGISLFFILPSSSLRELKSSIYFSSTTSFILSKVSFSSSSNTSHLLVSLISESETNFSYLGSSSSTKVLTVSDKSETSNLIWIRFFWFIPLTFSWTSRIHSSRNKSWDTNALSKSSFVRRFLISPSISSIFSERWFTFSILDW